MIPEAAVEAAAKWMHDNDCRSALHSGFPADFECYDWMDEARELLEAAAPFIAAQAWDKCAGNLVYDDGTRVELVSNANPYREATR